MGKIEKRLVSFVDDHADELIGIRHHLHAHPELSWVEEETTAYLVDRLERCGLTPRVLRQGTGLLCDIGDGAESRIALRADLDALPVTDVKDVPYKSQVEGVCHACGHDVHTTAVLGAGLAFASLLAEGGWPLGTVGVRLIFQPAEEDVPSGAPMVIADGGLEDVSHIFALHCEPRLDVGCVGLRVGSVTAAADSVNIRLTGPGGHTARPQLTVDLVGLAAKVVTDLTFGVSRLTDVRGGVNLTFGAIHGGRAGNVIPTALDLNGSLRALDRRTWETAPELVARLLESSVRPYGADYELDYRRGAPPIVNERQPTEIVAAAASRLLGPRAVVSSEQTVGGEDFSWYLERVRGAYVRLGVRCPGDAGAPHDLHDGAFDVDEDAIVVGARLLACVAAEAARRTA